MSAIDFGAFALQTLERAWITNTQIEAARVALTRNMKRKGKLWIRIFPGQVGDRASAGNPHGQGQRRSRALGRHGSPRKHPFRTGWRPGIRRPRIAAPGRRQAAHPHQVPHPPPRSSRCLTVMKIKEIRETDERRTWRPQARAPRGDLSSSHPAAERPARKTEPHPLRPPRNRARRDVLDQKTQRHRPQPSKP